MTLLYPSDPLDPRQPDAAYADEHAAATAEGLNTALFSFEDLLTGRLNPRQPLSSGVVVYRGWMLTLGGYDILATEVARHGARLLTSPAQYRRGHHLPGWYPVCRDVTPETLFLAPDDDVGAALARAGWDACFVKDHVKSLTSARGSIARTPGEVWGILDALKKHRGHLEGGVCLRRVERFRPNTEERFFAHHGDVWARTEEAPPPLVLEVARRLDLPFIAIDVAEREDGALRLFEVGDGQVSDRKDWHADRLLAVLRALLAPVS